MVQYLQVEYFHPCLNILYAEAFSYLEALEEQPYVPIVISSYGGYTDCLSTLLDCIQGSSKPVVVISTGVAMSCGADLFASGTKGLRIVGPNTTTLIHQVGGCAWGKASDMEAENRETQRVNEQFLYKLFDKTGNHPEGFTKNLIKENFNADLYLTPEQMIEYGWADKIMPINQALTNLDSIFDDYKKQLEAVELSEEMSEFIGDLDRCKPKDDEDKKKCEEE